MTFLLASVAAGFVLLASAFGPLGAQAAGWANTATIATFGDLTTPLAGTVADNKVIEDMFLIDDNNAIVAHGGSSVVSAMTLNTFGVTIIAGQINVGSDTDHATGTSGTIYGPVGIVKDTVNSRYIIITLSHCIRTLGLSSPYALGSLAGACSSGGDVDGAFSTSRFRRLRAIVPETITSAEQKIYITDNANRKARWFTLNGQTVSTLFGDASSSSTLGGPYADARVRGPTAMGQSTSDTTSLYIHDFANMRTLHVNLVSEFVKVIAGNGLEDIATGTPTAALSAGWKAWTGLLLLDKCRFLMDTYERNYLVLYDLTTNSVTTVAGDGTENDPPTDGTGASATFGTMIDNSPVGLDSTGKVWIADNPYVRTATLPTTSDQNLLPGGVYRGACLTATATLYTAVVAKSKTKTLAQRTSTATILIPASKTKTLVVKTSTKTIVVPTKTRTIVPRTTTKTIVVPTNTKTIVQRTSTKTIVVPTKTTTVVVKTETNTLIPPTPIPPSPVPPTPIPPSPVPPTPIPLSPVPPTPIPPSPVPPTPIPPTPNPTLQPSTATPPTGTTTTVSPSSLATTTTPATTTLIVDSSLNSTTELNVTNSTLMPLTTTVAPLTPAPTTSVCDMNLNSYYIAWVSQTCAGIDASSLTAAECAAAERSMTFGTPLSFWWAMRSESGGGWIAAHDATSTMGFLESSTGPTNNAIVKFLPVNGGHWSIQSDSGLWMTIPNGSTSVQLAPTRATDFTADFLAISNADGSTSFRTRLEGRHLSVAMDGATLEVTSTYSSRADFFMFIAADPATPKAQCLRAVENVKGFADLSCVTDPAVTALAAQIGQLCSIVSGARSLSAALLSLLFALASLF